MRLTNLMHDSHVQSSGKPVQACVRLGSCSARIILCAPYSCFSSPAKAVEVAAPVLTAVLPVAASSPMVVAWQGGLAAPPLHASARVSRRSCGGEMLSTRWGGAAVVKCWLCNEDLSCDEQDAVDRHFGVGGLPNYLFRVATNLDGGINRHWRCASPVFCTCTSHNVQRAAMLSNTGTSLYSALCCSSAGRECNNTDG